MPMEAPALVLLARQLGEHSLAWFAGVLAVSVLGAAMACRALHWRRLRRSSAEEPDERQPFAGMQGHVVQQYKPVLASITLGQIPDGRSRCHSASWAKMLLEPC